jgi:hypothetical protein
VHILGINKNGRAASIWAAAIGEGRGDPSRSIKEIKKLLGKPGAEV